LQTHISYVAIVSPYVYKLKKPVALDFLDFSTLAKREHFCRREIELNRRLCPDVYLGIVPLVLCDGCLRFGDENSAGSVVDYAVKMRELEERFFFSLLLSKGKASQADIDRIIGKMAPFYQRQRPDPAVTENGRAETVVGIKKDNLDEARDLVGDTVSASAYESVQIYQQRFHEDRRALLARRPADGRILDCHGDLRPEHIHLGPKRVCVYDCIEFNDKFRHIDVAAEVAFLAMELDVAGRRDLGRYLITEMVRTLDDPDMRRLMNFYKCCRAVVQAKVQGIRKDERNVPPAQREESRRKSGSYFQRALYYAVTGSRATVLAVMGRIATGKSSIAAALGAELGWAVHSSDRIRKRLYGVPNAQRPTASVRERLYGDEMTQRTYDRPGELARDCAEKGKSVLLDATYGTRQRRGELCRVLEHCDCDLVFVEVEAPNGVIRERLQAREHERDVTSDARLEDFDALARAYDPPSNAGPGHLITLDGTKPLHESRLALYKHLIERRDGGPAEL
jgi:aminoglycoside phosphotransferase family enzyme/predicted kinase